MIAFDYKGTLDDHPLLREWVKRAKKEGQKPVVISALAPNDKDDYHSRAKEIENLGLDIPYYICEYTGKHYNGGLEKAKIMKKLGIKVLVDNDPEFIKAVNDEGLEGLLVE